MELTPEWFNEYVNIRDRMDALLMVRGTTKGILESQDEAACEWRLQLEKAQTIESSILGTIDFLMPT